MKKRYIRGITLAILVWMMLSLAGCEQLSGLQALLPGGQKEAAAEGEGDAADPSPGALSDLQGAVKWVYLIEEDSTDKDAPTGILVYDPALAGYRMDGVTDTRAYIDWDDREFDLEARSSQTSPDWYYSAQLATNIRREQYVLRIRLLAGEEEEEIRLDNPQVALLEWPEKKDKTGIRMEKSGDGYTFSAAEIGDLFTDAVPGVFSYRIKDCENCNVQLDGRDLKYVSVSGRKAAFTVEVTDPAGVSRDSRVEIGLVRNLTPLLVPAVIFAIIILAAGFFLSRMRKRGKREEKEKLIAAQEDILRVLGEAQPLLDQCRQLSRNARSAREEALQQYQAYGGGVISREVIEDAARDAEEITVTPAFETLRVSVQDLENMQEILAGGKKTTLGHQNWNRDRFLDPAARAKELGELREVVKDLRKAFADANHRMGNLTEYTNPGKNPFPFSFAVRICLADGEWITTIKKGAPGSQELGSLYYNRTGKRITSGQEFLSPAAACVQIFSLDEESILVFSEQEALRENGDKAGKSSIRMQRSGQTRFSAGDPEETIEIIGQE